MYETFIFLKIAPLEIDKFPVLLFIETPRKFLFRYDLKFHYCV